MKIEGHQRRLADLPYCCRDEITRTTATTEPKLLAGIECPECAAFWLNIAPRMWVMESELALTD